MIEDDPDIASLLEVAPTSQGFDVTIAPDGLSGIEAVASLDPDLVTLDVGLPGIDGLEVCRRIRPTTDAYLIMITAYDEEIDRLIGLEAGADDYLTKPIRVRELKTRVNVLFRRPRRLATPAAPAPATLPPEGPWRLHAVRDEEEVDLTPTEFNLLATLTRAPTRVWTRELLLEEVWGGGREETHLVEVHMGNLRRKLGDRRGRVRFVENVRGVGYRMRAVG